MSFFLFKTSISTWCFSDFRGFSLGFGFFFSQNRDCVQKIQNWSQCRNWVHLRGKHTRYNTNLFILESFQPFRAQLFEHRHVFAVFAVVVVFFKNFLLLRRVRRRRARRTQLHRYHAMVAAKTFLRIYFALL